MAFKFDITEMVDRGTFYLDKVSKSQVGHTNVGARAQAYPDPTDPTCANVDVAYQTASVSGSASQKIECIPVQDATVSISITARTDSFGDVDAPTRSEVTAMVTQLVTIAIFQLYNDEADSGDADFGLASNYEGFTNIVC